MKSERFLKQLKEEGFRITKIRRWLVGFFGFSDLPITIPNLLDRMAEDKIRASKTTIYRELEFLAHHGLIMQVDLLGSELAYESALGHHHHLICESCSKALHIDVEDLEVKLREVQKWLESQSGFTHLSHHLEFLGICSKCRR
jgi:Fur family transcriptional regulator, ferric uptake regulator